MCEFKAVSNITLMSNEGNIFNLAFPDLAVVKFSVSHNKMFVTYSKTFEKNVNITYFIAFDIIFLLFKSKLNLIVDKLSRISYFI